METYTATATRDNGWWVVEADVPNAIIVTEARRLDQVDAMLRDAIASALDIPEDSFGVAVTVDLGDELARQVERTREVSRRANEAQAEAAARTRATAQLLRDHGYTVRDSGRVMGVSPQRVSQLLA